MPVNAPLRVVQWATGAVGRYALRSVLSRPGLELAGVLVYDHDKIGKDAGELVGLPYAGVSCTDDPERVMAIEADCVLHMPLPSFYFGPDRSLDLVTICALLASGKNVITTTGFVYPKSYGPRVVERIEAACDKGGTTLHGTGINPGFMSDFLPLALTRLSDRIDHIYKADAGKVARWPDPGFAIHIEGVPQMTMSIDEVSHGLAAAAAHAINAIPAVCAAPPGIRTLLDLPLPTARARVRIR
jgi:hypothetical protein